MLVGHLEGIVAELVERVAQPLGIARWGADILIADINPCPEAWKVDVDPIWVLWYCVEKAAILEDICIDGVLEAIGIARAIESPVFVRREIDPEITASLRCVGAVTGYKTGKYQQNSGRFGHGVVFKILRV
jgi:hypothetical protein